MADSITVALKLLETRASLRAFWGSDYETQIAPARQLVREAMAMGQLEPLPAAIRIAKHFTDQGNGMCAMAVLSAAADITEGA